MDLNLAPPSVMREVGAGLLVAVLLVSALSVVDNKNFLSFIFPNNNLMSKFSKVSCNKQRH